MFYFLVAYEMSIDYLRYLKIAYRMPMNYLHVTYLSPRDWLLNAYIKPRLYL